MPTLLDKQLADEKPVIKPERDSFRTSQHLRWILPISFLLLTILIIIASFQNPTKTDEDRLEELQAKVENREPLEKYEKEAYCDLLWKLKKVRLCACKKNFIKDIGSLTGYEIKESDLDLRNSGKTFTEALEEAFKRTKVPKEQFIAKKWALDINGKSGVVEWRAPGGAEVSIDAPHSIFGPDVFHIGFQTNGKGKDQISGHIFVDCVPYFREIKK